MVQCRACEGDNPDDAKFCMQCGQQLRQACSSCGADLPAEARFCAQCGTAASASSTASDESADQAAQLPAALGGGRFRLEKQIGEGSKKKVYLARDTRLDRQVALSLLKTDGLDANTRLRVRREAQAMARLGDHPNIVTVFDVEEDGDELFMVSSYMAGGGLDSRLKKVPEGRLPIDEVLTLATDVCGALAYAHKHDVVHRDVKPGNIWFGEDGAACLGDFGLAISAGDAKLTQSGTVLGTADYMPPEQAMGGASTPQSDLYSLGAMLYELATGRPPFVGDDAVGVIGQHINSPPVAPRFVNSAIPPELEVLILTLLSKDPGDRPAGAEQVRLAVEAIQARDHRTTMSAEILNPLDTLAQRVFVGREAELQQLRSGIDAAIAGAGRVLLLVGEPGIGKTRTSEEIATYATMRGAGVFWGRCYEGEGAPAYWPWVQIMREYIRDTDAAALLNVVRQGAPALADVVPELRDKLPGLNTAPPLEAEEARFRLFESINGFLQQASLDHPMLLVLDDLHWADKPSLLLLQYLAREISGMPVAILATYRDVELGRTHPLADTLAELARIGFGERVLLRGITEADIARFGELTTHQALPNTLVNAVYRETEGNPFFVNEVLRLLASEGRLGRSGMRSEESLSLSIPQGIREVVGRRLNALSSRCNELLTMASVVGREFDIELLVRLPELAGVDVLEAVDEAAAARVVEEMNDRIGRYRFSHALVRETLLEELSTARRVRLHRSVGELLEAYYGEADDQHLAELAYHAAEGAMAGGDVNKAIGYAKRAAERASRLNAFEEAVPHYQRALQVYELAPDRDPMERVDLLLSLAEAQHMGVDREQAAGTLERAIELADAAGDVSRFARGAAQLSMARFVLGEPVPESVARLEDALTRLGEEIRAERVMVLTCLSQQWGLGDHVDRAYDYAKQALAVAERLGDGAERLRAISAVVRSAPREDVAERERLLVQELELARELRDPSAEVQALGLLRMFAVTKGDRVLFERCLDESEPVLERTQNLATKGFHLVGRALSAALDGDWQRADQTAQQAYQATSRTFGPAGVQMFAIHQSIQMQIHGRNAELLAMLEESAATHAQPAWRAALAMAYALQGEPEKARAVLTEFCTDDMAALPVDGNWLSGAGLLAIGADLIGDRAAAAVLYPRLLPFAGSMINVGSTAGIHGSTGAHIGAMCGLLDRWEEGERFFRQAIAQTDAFGHRHYESDSRLSFARFYQRRAWPGDAEAALQLVNEALEIARRFQMEGYIQRAIAMKLEIQGAVGEGTAGSIHALTMSMAERDAGEVSGVEDHGLTTLMFSDMAGFTAMTERLGDVAAREVIRIHNSIVREQLNSHGGVEVELQGDGFLLAFSDAARALDCGVSIQRAFTAENQNGTEPIHVRIGLHSGTALRDGGKFFGKTVILASRIAAQAVGGELLISDSLKPATDGRYAVTDTRVLELKGIADPQTVHSVVWDG